MSRFIGYAEQYRKLAHNDMDGDACEKACRDGDGKQGREPAGPEQANGD
jgi:hypothetical protein